MAEITLRQVDESNFIDCFNLKLGDGQEKYVSHPIRSLAQAYVYREQSTPFAVCCGDKTVGYIMVIYDYDEQAYNLWHLMIDCEQQGKGYGRAALRASLDYIKKQPFGESRTVLMTCNPDNVAAMSLYKSEGFTPTGRDDDDEVELGLNL